MVFLVVLDNHQDHQGYQTLRDHLFSLFYFLVEPRTRLEYKKIA